MRRAKGVIFAALMLVSANVGAASAWSSTLTLTSDYLFNGISQTQDKPALQASVDWAGDRGFYIGAWGSKVHFGDGTDLELDAYGGYSSQLASWLSMDIGAAQYSYHGADRSSDGNYGEVYTKLSLTAGMGLKAWYAWDYFGTGADHVILMLDQSIDFAEVGSLLLAVDVSRSLDEDRFVWSAGDPNYLHWQLTWNLSSAGFDWSWGIHGTDLDSQQDVGRTRVLLTLSRSFEL